MKVSVLTYWFILLIGIFFLLSASPPKKIPVKYFISKSRRVEKCLPDSLLTMESLEITGYGKEPVEAIHVEVLTYYLNPENCSAICFYHPRVQYRGKGLITYRWVNGKWYSTFILKDNKVIRLWSARSPEDYQRNYEVLSTIPNLPDSIKNDSLIMRGSIKL